MVAALLVAWLAQVPAPALSGDRSVTSKCEVSDDRRYGYSIDNPIRVGGLPIYGASRQQRYLRALGGPAGQAVTFKRLGAVGPNKDDVLIDLYEVQIAGDKKKIELFLDFYHWDPPKAPRGFVCLTEIGLAEPAPPDEGERRLVELAIAAASKEDVPPIPLGADGSTQYGVAIDRFRYVAAAARGQIAMGQPVTPEALTGVFGNQFFVIANPVKCDGKTRRPRGILVRGSNGLVAKPRRVLDAAAVRAFFPWVKVSDGALGAMFTGAHPPPAGEVAIGYDGPACQGESDNVVLPVKAGIPKKIADAAPVWPADVHPSTLSAPAVVEVRARIGVDGVPRDLEAISGPPAFLEPALDAVRQWRYAPFTINGAPAYAPIVMTVRVTFSRKGGDLWPD